MMFDILESELRIKYMGQFAKKYLAEWLRDCCQVCLGAKGAVLVSVNKLYNECEQVINAIDDMASTLAMLH
jgi:hypothetical protein